MLHLTGSSSVPSTQFFPAFGVGSPDIYYLISFKCACTTAGIAGSVIYTMTWTDPYLGAQSRSIGPLSLLAVGNVTDLTFPVNQASNTAVNYSVITFGLIGTPSYDIQVTYVPTS